MKPAPLGAGWLPTLSLSRLWVVFLGNVKGINLLKTLRPWSDLPRRAQASTSRGVCPFSRVQSQVRLKVEDYDGEVRTEEAVWCSDIIIKCPLLYYRWSYRLWFHRMCQSFLSCGSTRWQIFIIIEIIDSVTVKIDSQIIPIREKLWFNQMADEDKRKVEIETHQAVNISIVVRT